MRLLAALTAVLAMQLVPGSGTPGDLVLSQFGMYLEALRNQAGIPGLSAAIVGDQDIRWERGFGSQDLEQALAASPDTLYHLDGLTQVVTAALVLRCAEEGRLTVDDAVGVHDPFSPYAGATIRQILTHTSGFSGSATFLYEPQRLTALQPIVRACTGDSYRETVSVLLAQLGMMSSVPGQDVVGLAPPAEGIPDAFEVERYALVLGRLATPYTVDFGGARFRSQYAAATLTPSSGLISSVRDLALMDLSLKNGVLLRPDTRAAGWQAPLDLNSRPLPHALGWFVQGYRGEIVAWQFGLGDGASSSLIVTLPARGLTLILLANSDGLTKPFGLHSGDLTTSPFGRVFLGLFVP